MSVPSSDTPLSPPQGDIAVEESASRLIPPNPAILTQQPRGSILLNRNDATCVPPSTANASIKSSSSVLSNVKNAFLFGESSRPRQPGPPAAVYNDRNRASSVSSTGSSASTGSFGGMAAQSQPGRRRAPSPSVSFAPLPYVPNLERRRSITLGVAARSNLLKTQGSAAGGMGNASAQPIPGAPSRRDGRKGYLMMTDEEWEYYKKEQAKAGQAASPPELHHLVRDSGKKLWQKARSLSSSSSKSPSSPKTLGKAVDSSDTVSLTSVSSRSSPPESLAEYSDSNPPSGSSTLKPRPVRRAASYQDVEESEIGSIAEEEEEEEEEEEALEPGDEVRVELIPNRYLATNGVKPRTESVSTTSDGRSSAGESSYDDDEDDPPVELPAYLRKDMEAERHHYMHEHEGHQSRSGTATPTATAFEHERHHHQLHELPSRSSIDENSGQNQIHHAHLAKHLMAMDLNQGQGDRANLEGDATPRGRGSPRMRPLSTTGYFSDGP